MTKKIFVAIKISKNLQEKIHAWRKRYEGLSVRWIGGEDMHVTVIPPWYEGKPEEIIKILKGLEGKVGGFNVQFNWASYGPPPPSQSRLIWATGDAPSEILDLKKEIENALNIEPEKRPFRLHLTVARFRPENFHDFPVREINDKVDWQDYIESFVLMESLPRRAEGIKYKVLKEIKL